jgi:hypothetical protein
MDDTEKPHKEKYQKIMNDWNYNNSCMFASLPVLDFKGLIFVAQSVQWGKKGESDMYSCTK